MDRIITLARTGIATGCLWEDDILEVRYDLEGALPYTEVGMKDCLATL